MIIRPPTHHDLDGINRLMRNSRAYDGPYRAMLDGYAVTPAQLDRDVFRVLDHEGRVEGFFSLTSGPPLELDLMFVDDRIQGSGIGARLFDAVKQVAGDLGSDEVLIVSHPPSVGFYERMGAVRIGEKPPSGRVAWARSVLVLKLDAHLQK